MSRNIRAGISENGMATVYQGEKLVLSLFNKKTKEPIMEQIIDLLDIIDLKPKHKYQDYEYAGRVHIDPLDVMDKESKRSFTLLDCDLNDLLHNRSVCLYCN